MVAVGLMKKLGFRGTPFYLYFQPVAKNLNPLKIGVEKIPGALKSGAAREGSFIFFQ